MMPSDWGLRRQTGGPNALASADEPEGTPAPEPAGDRQPPFVGASSGHTSGVTARR